MKAATRHHRDPYKLYHISIHAAREGGDYEDWVGSNRVEISIHAAREGGDDPKINSVSEGKYFNPRRP